MRIDCNRRRLAVLLLVVTLGASCFGPMNATRRMHAWNRSIENRWAGEAVYSVLLVVPGYLLAIVGDVLIFNYFDFWGQRNPMAPPSPRQLREIEELDEDRHG